MNVMTTTPFGQRSLTATLMKRAAEAQQAVAVREIDKWSLFRDICTARDAFCVTDRALTVLNALMSFHKGNLLSADTQLVVFPSNRALSERAHGMAESTLRRHLAALSNAGLIQRHDSPNGKRYAARGAGGAIAHAFGFDLRPLLVRAGQIAQAATAAKEAALRLRSLRSEVTLLKRDAIKLSFYAQECGVQADWAAIDALLFAIHKTSRRALDIDGLTEVKSDLSDLVTSLRNLINTEEVSGSDAVIERHYQNSNKDSSDLEPCLEKARGQVAEHKQVNGDTVPKVNDMPPIPLGLVMKACPDIIPYAAHGVKHWHDLVATASHVRGMMGISVDAWEGSVRQMGPEVAAVTVAAILQRVDHIASPGGYLRSLTKKAADGGFSPGPMIMALLRTS